MHQLIDNPSWTLVTSHDWRDLAARSDVLELVLYNAALAGVSLDGTKFFYTNTLRQLDRMPAELRWPT